jgi:hypothetical protein
MHILLFYKDEIGKPVRVVDFLDEIGCQELGDLLTYGLATLIIEAAHALVHRFGIQLDAKLVLGDLPRNA